MPEELDLRAATVGVPSVAEETAAAGRKPSTDPYDPSPEREMVRSSVALYLVYLLIAVISVFILVGAYVTFACLTKGTCVDGATSLAAMKLTMEVVLTPLVGIVASVIGFYFGEKSGSSER